MRDPIAVLSWLLVAHLVGDFVLQTGRMAVDKQADGPRAWRALRDHSAGVALALVPVVVAFGIPGLAYLIVIAVSHALIDRSKVLLTRGAEARALRAAFARYGTLSGAGGLGTAWTPIPAALFVADQLAHGLVLAVAAAVLLQGDLTAPWVDAVRLVSGGLGEPTVRAVGLDTALAVALTIVNVRAASLLIGTLVSPREVTLGRPPLEPGAAQVALAQTAGARPREGASAGGPDTAATVSEASADVSKSSAGAAVSSPSPDPADPGPTSAGDGRAGVTGESRPAAAARAQPAGPARIGEAIGVLERLLVVTFVLTGQLAAIGFVVAAKTLARFKQLDDRGFAEYYLLGTLASVSVALGSALLAAAALAATP
jgi:hypothetical protein